jgi:penicillin-binding protein 2
MMKLFNPDVSPGEYRWFDGDTVRTSIGQANNQYTALSMAKYTATLATGGVRYQAHLLDRITTQQHELVREFGTVTEYVMDLAPENVEAVFRGMLETTSTPRGTAYATFRNFPVSVAGKTGTGQEATARNNHSTFSAFAPFEEPEIAVFVQLPFGDSRYMPRSAAELAKKVIAEYMGFNVEPQYAEETNVLAM